MEQALAHLALNLEAPIARFFMKLVEYLVQDIRFTTVVLGLSSPVWFAITMFWVKTCGACACACACCGGVPRGVLGPAEAAAVGSITRRATGLVLSLLTLL